MATPGAAYLGAIRLQAQQRSDMVNSNFISTTEWNSYATNSYKELYDLLVSAYGNDYYVKTPYSISLDGTNYQYALPGDFYKGLGVDLVLQGAQSNTGSNITLKPYNFSDRNRYAVPNFQSFYGVTNLRYRFEGDYLWFTPIPAGGQTAILYYIPQPVNLQVYFAGSLTNSSAVVTVTDTSQLSVGMSVYGLSGVASGATISSISTNVSVTLSVASTATVSNQIMCAWSDTTQINGISGWEEYIITDMAIKAMQKEESDVSILAAQKMDLRQRLQDMAANRDVGSSMTVADTQTSDLWWPAGGNGSGSY